MNAPFAVPSSGPIKRYETREALGYLPRGWIDGLTLSNDTTDATNDIGVAAGCARSTVNIVDGNPSTLTRDQIDLDLPVAIIKQLDVAFAPENYNPRGYSGGDRSGGRSSSALSNTTWHAILAGGIGLQPDVFLHDAATQSSILAEMQKIGGYTAYRRIGAILRESAAIVGFTQVGNEFLRNTTAADINANAPGTSSTLRTLSVPLGIKVTATLQGSLNSSTPIATLCYINSPDMTDEGPAVTRHTFKVVGASGAIASGEVRVRTNTSAQIRTALSASDGNVTLILATLGWTDLRGKDA